LPDFLVLNGPNYWEEVSFSDRIFIDNFNSQHDLGIFSLASRISSVVTLVSTAIFMSYTPIYYSRAKEQTNYVFRFNQYIILVILFLCLFIIITSNYLVVFFLGLEYQGTSKIVQLICLSLFISNATGIVNLSYYNNEKIKVIAIVILFSSLMSIVLNWLGIKKYGIEAAATVNSISALLNFSILILYAKNKFNMYFPFQVFFGSFLCLLTIILLQSTGLIIISVLFMLLILFNYKSMRSELLSVVSNFRDK